LHFLTAGEVVDLVAGIEFELIDQVFL